MLPAAHFIDDRQWIASQIKQIPVELWESTAEAYTKVYTEAYAEKQNEGELLQIQHARTTANTRLRRYVQAVSEKLSPRKTQ